MKDSVYRFSVYQLELEASFNFEFIEFTLSTLFLIISTF